MSDKPRLDHALAVAWANRDIQQHGQADAEDVFGGSTACTHAICQFLFQLWHDERKSLNEINALAGMPRKARNADGDPRGMRPEEVQKFFEKAGIPMVLKFGREFQNILAASNRGPVFYGMRYGSAPRRRGFGPTENGFARPRKRGATQFGIANERHAVLLLGYLQVLGPDGTPIRTDVYRKEPNHGSGARPERPPYDIIHASQARKEYNDYHDKLGISLYAAIVEKGKVSPS